MLMPWRFRQPLAHVRSVVDGPNTLYLCSPRGEQRHYEPLFRGALRMVLEEQQRRVELAHPTPSAPRARRSGDRRLARRARPDGLDGERSRRHAGDGPTGLLSVEGPLGSRGPRPSSTTTPPDVVLGGLADPTASQYLPELFETRKDAPPLGAASSATAGHGHGDRRTPTGLPGPTATVVERSASSRPGSARALTSIS